MNQLFVVIIPAAGRSVRYGGQNKLLEPLGGKPVVARAVGAFLGRPDVVAVILAAPVADFSEIQLALGHGAGDQRVKLCVGGDCRAESVRNALQQAPAEAQWVAVHDAARPLVSQALNRSNVRRCNHPRCRCTRASRRADDQASRRPAAGQGSAHDPAPRSLGNANPPGDAPGRSRSRVRNLSASFGRSHRRCQLLELAGKEVWLVTGEERNLKITTPADHRIAEMHLAEEAKV